MKVFAGSLVGVTAYKLGGMKVGGGSWSGPIYIPVLAAFSKLNELCDWMLLERTGVSDEVSVSGSTENREKW